MIFPMAAVHTHVDVADEDAVSYWIFPDWNESEIDDDRLEEFRTKCFTFLSERSGPYIWHEDAINLKPVGPDSTGTYGSSIALFLVPSTRYLPSNMAKRIVNVFLLPELKIKTLVSYAVIRQPLAFEILQFTLAKCLICSYQ